MSCKEYSSKEEFLKIPKDHFVDCVNLDADEPYCIICHNNNLSEEIKLTIPKALAYYLTTHFCGSEKMEKRIENHTKKSLQNELKELLGINQ